MKKLIFSLAVLGFASYLNAQTTQIEGRHPLFKDEAFSTMQHKPKMGKTDVATWYSPGAWSTVDPTISAGMKGYVDFMFHDTIAKSVMMYTSGEATVHGIGYISLATICDPKDDVIDYTDDPGSKLYRHIGYQLDSINFIYRYIRHADSLDDGIGGKIVVVDTLFVHYFKGAQITKSGLTFTGPPQRSVRYAYTGWQGGSVRMPANAFWTDTILLGINDTTTAFNNPAGGFENQWNSKQMTLAAPAGMTSAANQDNNLVGFSLTFKAGVQSVIGTDTAVVIYQKDPATLPPGTRRTNYFGYSLLQNEGGNKWSNPTYYNTSLFSDNTSAYTPWVANPNLQFNGYFPGMIYVQERFVNTNFFIKSTTGNVGMKEISNDFGMTNVFPNPAKSSEKAVVGFKLNTGATVSVSIINLLGQEVKAVFTKSFQSGEHAEFIDLSGMKPGIYLVNMTVNGTTVSKKLNVVE